MADPELSLDLYTRMRRVRATSDRLKRGLSSGEFQCNFWPVQGSEATSAGVCAALRDEDRLIVTYRATADAVAKGAPIDGLIAEYLGYDSGLSGGRGGATMGVTHLEVGMIASTGIVGSGAPIANGLALASQLSGDGLVTVVSFGDGATSIGSMHEAMNLAALWSLPVIFLCHNNLIAEGTPIEGYTRTERLADRAKPYGMVGVTVDGTDPLAVHAAAESAVDRARSGEGPTFLECIAQRIEGHHFGDGTSAGIPEGRVEAAIANEPVGKFREVLAGNGLGAEADDIDQQVEVDVESAFESALAGSHPDPDGLRGEVFSGGVREVTGEAQTPVRPPDGSSAKLGLVATVNATLDSAMAADERVILLGEDIADPIGGLFRATAGLSAKYGTDRVRATPIAETSILGAAVGAALAGYRPVAEIMFCDFLAVCMDQLANHAAKYRFTTGGALSVPLTVRSVVGAAGPQHSQSLEAWAMHTPGLKVVFPANAADAKGLLRSCIDDDDPCLILEAMSIMFGGGAMEVPDADYRIPLGLADVKREGSDVTVVAYGPATGAALAAADELDADGTSAEVVDLRSLVPLDMPTVLESAARTKKVVIAQAAVEFAGAGAEIAARINDELFGELDAPVARVGAAYSPVPHATTLVAEHSLTPARIRAAVEALQ